MNKLLLKFKGGQSFSLAFAAARKAGKDYFTWKGRTYGTKTRDEVNAPLLIWMYTYDGPNFTYDIVNGTKVPKIEGDFGNIGTDLEGLLRYTLRNEGITHKTKRGKVSSRKDVDAARLRAATEIANDLTDSTVGEAEAKSANRRIADYMHTSETPYTEIIGDNGSTAFINQRMHNELGEDGKWLDVKGAPTGQQAFGTTVDALRTHIKTNGNNLGLIHLSSIGDKNGSNIEVWQDYNTGRGYITDRDSGEILFATDDQSVMFEVDKNGNITNKVRKRLDPTQWGRYHTGLNGDSYLAKLIFAGAKSRRKAARSLLDIGNLNVQIANNLRDQAMLNNITNAQERGATYLNYLPILAMHTIWGGINLLGTGVANAGKAIYDTGKGVLTGNFNYGYIGQTPLDFINGYGFKRDSNGKIDWFGPTSETITGLGGIANRNGAFNNLSEANRMALTATGDIAGNILLGNLREFKPGRTKVVETTPAETIEVPAEHTQVAEPIIEKTGQRAVNTTLGQLMQSVPRNPTSGEGLQFAGRFGGGKLGTLVLDNGLTEGTGGIVTNGTHTTSGSAANSYVAGSNVSVPNVTNNGAGLLVGMTSESPFQPLGQGASFRSPHLFTLHYNSNPVGSANYAYSSGNGTTITLPGKTATKTIWTGPNMNLITPGLTPIYNWRSLQGFSNMPTYNNETVEYTTGGYKDPYIYGPNGLFNTGSAITSNLAYPISDKIIIPGNLSTSNMAVALDGKVDTSTGFKTAAPAKEHSNENKGKHNSVARKHLNGGILLLIPRTNYRKF